MSETIQKETLGFQAEVKKLLHLVVHSLYSNKEIFLRELISNAADAADKLRFRALSQPELYGNDSELKIRIETDADAGTLSIIDNGIGMTREEIIDNLGTIAKSGTADFIKQLSGDEAKDSRLIGQFGVGFYSSYIVADTVTVRSLAAGSTDAVVWSSDGEGQFTIEPCDKTTRGTEIILHLKDDDKDFLQAWKLRSIITKYSDHISLPVEMQKEQPPAEDGDEAVVAPVEYEVVNKATALWTLSRNEITTEQYQEFYKHLSHDFEAPLAWSHNRVEGKLEYTSLLYIPAKAPFNMRFRDERKQGLKLYVQRVFIMEDAEQLLPSYLRFVRGVVDSNDLPLNVSRELLQDSKIIDSIRKASIKKILDTLENLAENDADKYLGFWKEFGSVLKEGPAEDYANREQIAKLLRFSSTHTDSNEPTVSLPEYLGRMKDGQKKIYFVFADSFNAAKHSPHLEIFRKKGIEVLLLSERVDEWMMSYLTEFDGRTIQSVTRGSLDLSELADNDSPTEEAQKERAEQFDSLLKQMQQGLGERVKEVRLTDRLTSSPACVVAEEQGISSHMAALMKEAGQQGPEFKPVFEINPEHQLIQKLKAETDDERFQEWTEILFDQAMLAESGRLEDPSGFVNRLNRMLLQLAV